MIRDSGGKNKKQNFELMGKKEGKKSRVVERDGQDQSSIYMFILVFPRLSTAARDNVGKFWVLFFVWDFDKSANKEKSARPKKCDAKKWRVQSSSP